MFTFREIVSQDADMILRWRMSNRVTKFMNTDVIYDLDAQNKWLSSCYSKEHYYHWIILNDDVPVGLINLADYSSTDKISSWGFYIGAEGLDAYGAFIPPYFYNFLFNTLRVNRINVEVFYSNINVIGLHLLHGYKFTPDNDRVIAKNGKDILLVAMRLEKSNWNSKRYGKNLALFPISKWNLKPIFLIN
jgi:RimJ/RimL family protein N-acetyltransferase